MPITQSAAFETKRFSGHPFDSISVMGPSRSFFGNSQTQTRSALRHIAH